ncbi:hypothetical protein HPB49_011350 [Dermacentor silvarum]|uniref:Uncharacterized protein n=1 Tax=Dermacentor silvarum TaxID=543639 RepID=A0ACB8CET6_DERSI|nr:hypothetical protein HPB49_011350 [Dermacentor silvarum]
MELAYAGVIRVKPASDFPLSPWLSTSVVVVASQTFAAYASVGLSWPSLNSYLLKPQIGPAIAELVSSLTNGRVLTAVAAKKIYRTNIRVFKTLLWADKVSSNFEAAQYVETSQDTGMMTDVFFADPFISRTTFAEVTSSTPVMCARGEVLAEVTLPDPETYELQVQVGLAANQGAQGQGVDADVADGVGPPGDGAGNQGPGVVGANSRCAGEFGFEEYKKDVTVGDCRTKTATGIASLMFGDLEDFLKPDVCHAALKEEAKAWFIVSTPMHSYVSMCYIFALLRKPFY